MSTRAVLGEAASGLGAAVGTATGERGKSGRGDGGETGRGRSGRVTLRTWNFTLRIRGWKWSLSAKE